MILYVPIGFGNRNKLTYLTYSIEIVAFKQTLLLATTVNIYIDVINKKINLKNLIF